MQVLVFFFHCLPLMQKKGFLLQLARHVIDIADAFDHDHVTKANNVKDTVPLGIARIVLLLDYFLHYFYDPPASLIEQVMYVLRIPRDREFIEIALGSCTQFERVSSMLSEIGEKLTSVCFEY